MKTWIYSWIIYPLVYSVACVVGIFQPKVRETLRLRSWKDYLSLRLGRGEPIEYWLHVASHGELEYAIPIVENLQKRKKRVLVTYYSISAKVPVEALGARFPNVSLVMPLPHDGLGFAKEFVRLAFQQGVRHLLLLKYELWPGLLWECNSLGIKVHLVDALKPGWFHRKLLHKLHSILSGYASEIDGLTHPNVWLLGDTRVERVLERMKTTDVILSAVIPTKIREGLRARSTLVCGSMWPKDTRLLMRALEKLKSENKELCNVVWVPHELSITHSQEAQKFLNYLGYMILQLEQLAKFDSALQVLNPLAIIVMKKGILAELYYLGEFAFVGGGFGSGIHSVWEPAIAGCKVSCGPQIQKSPEATELKKWGRLSVVKQSQEFAEWIESSSNKKPQEFTMDSILNVHIGAAHRIIDVCEDGGRK